MAPEHRRSAVRRLAFITAGVVVSAALAPGPSSPAQAASHPDPPRPAPVTHSAPPAEPPEGRIARLPAFGAYLHYGPAGLERMKELGRWLGGHEPRVGHTYLPGDLWRNIEGGRGFLDSWAEWRQDKADRMLVLNVPMMERNEENVPDAEVRQLLRRAADGEFDDHFEALAERLVELGAEDTVIVLGWEMNGVTYTHRCAPDPERWKRYWRRIVTVMRSVPGQDFRFDFAPSRGRDAIPWTQCYPGDDYVDIVGMDAYDQPRGLTFDQQVSEPYGLQHHVEFARAHDKPISYPEWGLFRNGDNITWMLRMLAWMDEHKPLYNTITDYCPHGVWLCSDNPRASALYRLLLSSPSVPQPHPQPEPGPSATVPTAPTTPAEPDPKPAPDGPATPTPMPSKLPYCAPLDLAKWFEQQVGGKLTVCLQWAEH
ncbi:glycosyl hydrolase [Streptomyces sp. T12]|uniref:glycosyl hydrolase n=1 Tax=Streptomyces sp. T12 TaxID=477697 RepID=UPI00236674C9|nr:glycosyl hydrolase [Streptomyces sp. T12]WDF38232.1 glycosyl hydrolase [Streptomyces sp. T12]